MALTAGDGFTVVRDLKHSLVGDGEAEPAGFAGAMGESATVGTDVSTLGIFPLDLGLRDTFQTLSAGCL